VPAASGNGLLSLFVTRPQAVTRTIPIAGTGPYRRDLGHQYTLLDYRTCTCNANCVSTNAQLSTGILRGRVERSNRFLLLSLLAMGGVALVLSAIASRSLTRPLKELAAAAASISEGALGSRAVVHEEDEIGSWPRRSTGWHRR
jgi:HAMP domain-containing protein